jgi:predicted N-acyltransferase
VSRTVALVTGVDAVDAARWNALRGTAFPFLRHAFLHALETSGSVGEGSGWQPRHLLLQEGEQLLAAMPCYAKTHSYGEYVFDWSWADAYNRHRVPYYPKLLSAVPFTPATGPRILVAEGVELREALAAFLPALREACERRYSSWHLLFPEPALAARCAELGLLRRTGVQYHWQNRGYASFEDFLARFASRKRKQLKKERRQVAEQGLEIRRLRGDVGTFLRFLPDDLRATQRPRRLSEPRVLPRDRRDDAGKSLARGGAA